MDHLVIENMSQPLAMGSGSASINGNCHNQCRQNADPRASDENARSVATSIRAKAATNENAKLRTDRGPKHAGVLVIPREAAISREYWVQVTRQQSGTRRPLEWRPPTSSAKQNLPQIRNVSLEQRRAA